MLTGIALGALLSIGSGSSIPSQDFPQCGGYARHTIVRCACGKLNRPFCSGACLNGVARNHPFAQPPRAGFLKRRSG